MAKKKSAVDSFVEFVREQGVVGLAVAVILGTAAKGVVDSLVADIINPVLGAIFDAESLASETFTIGDVTFGLGSFISTLINFTVVALVVYFVLNKAVSKFDAKK